jgi:Ras family protein
MSGDILRKRKIAVLGSRSVGELFHRHLLLWLTRNIPGKSSLVVQFIENHFVESYYPTIENTFSKSVNYKGVEYECDIIDTAGQVRGTLMLPFVRSSRSIVRTSTRY